jgi:hypothetical protein
MSFNEVPIARVGSYPMGAVPTGQPESSKLKARQAVAGDDASLRPLK